MVVNLYEFLIITVFIIEKLSCSYYRINMGSDYTIRYTLSI